ncbi:Na+/H+ antiporter NhaC family protein [Aquihabitans daechungensis]|uniref:Na+/H+ antiporter NhaC family protein n=1 Tax=Aquihabitans daechungensis TaxID=1052257 RepID=UPI003BA0EC35
MVFVVVTAVMVIGATVHAPRGVGPRIDRTSTVTPPEGADPDGIRPPSLLDALIPLVTLVVLLGLTISLFGTAATDGPLQVALMATALVAGLVALKNGYTSAAISDAAIGGVSSAMGAIYILLAVGALIGTWNMAGTIPTIVAYGIELLRPAIFYTAVAIICALVGAATGSSWTTAGTLGVAFMAMAPILGVSETIAAGAVISGAYVGDKMTPLSETTVLVPQLVGGVTTNEHIRGMVWTVAPAFGLSLVVFTVMGVTGDHASAEISTAAARDALEAVFQISPLNLLPIAALVWCALKRVPPFLAIFGTALLAGVMAAFTQAEVVEAFVDEPGQGPILTSIEGVYKAMATGFTLSSGNETIDSLFSRGGMASMLTTVWLILAALSFAAIMEHAGLLDRLISPLVDRVRSAAGLILMTAATAVGLNLVAGDQYVAVVLPSRVYRLEYARRGLSPRMLSRTVEDTGTVTSPLVPWNTCGAYMSGALGVSTISYAPWALFNIFNPLVAVAYAITGFRVERLPATALADGVPATDGPDTINEALRDDPQST